MAKIFTKEWQDIYRNGNVNVSPDLINLIFNRGKNIVTICVTIADVFFYDRDKFNTEEKMAQICDEDPELSLYDIFSLWDKYQRSLLFVMPPVDFFESLAVSELTSNRLKNIKIDFMQSNIGGPCYILTSKLYKKFGEEQTKRLFDNHKNKIKKEYFTNIISSIEKYARRF